MRVPYYCPYCNQRTTRRWNLDVHIRRRHGGYLLSESLDRYIGSSTPNNLYRNIGSTTVADSVGETFQPRYLPQRSTVGTSQYYTSPVYHPTHTMHDQSYGIGLSPETKQKIDEFTRLMNKYRQFHPNPDGIIKLAMHNCIIGDNMLL